MGKATKDYRNHRRKRRNDPIGNQNGNDNSSNQEDPKKQFPVFAQLASADESAREIACASASQFAFEDDDTVQKLIDLGLLKLLIEKLSDPILPVRTAAAGALRNFSMAGEKVCSRLVKDDCMTSLLAITAANRNFIHQELNAESTKEAQLLMTQIIAVFTNLCENSPKAVEIFSNTEAMGMAIQFLNLQNQTLEFAIETAQFLNIVTENNPICCKQLIDNPEMNGVLQKMIGDSQCNVYLRMLSAAILLNASISTNTLNQSLPTLFPIISSCMDFNPQSFSAALLTKAMALQVTDIEKFDDQLDETFKESEYPFKSQQLGLELLTNLFAGDEQEEQEMDMGNEEYIPVPDSSKNLQSQVPDHIKQLLNSQSLKKVVDQCEVTSQDFRNGFAQFYEFLSVKQREYEAHCKGKLTMKLQTREENLVNGASFVEYADRVMSLIKKSQTRALSLLTNLILMSSVQDLDANALWNFLCQQCSNLYTELSNVPDTTKKSEQYGLYLDGVTYNMLLLLRKMSSQNKNFAIDQTHIKGILDLAKNSQFEETRVNALGMIGTLGVLPACTSQLEIFGNVVLERCLEDASESVVAEALNTVFDVFAEPESNAAFTSTDMLQKLKKTSTILNQKLKNPPKNADEEALEKLEEAEFNLKNFLKYKADQFR
eukprot:TRINITY_DN5793_c0_g1_i1.p1 TRINITY_DN5793_c0_g1~~TRINITY_DN5793_c0_g1_i1.p1  ORF type:complete len:659 (+),score=250.18 TRINITY_DN5793_c0_g1_i1:107-2083(+)